MAVGLRRFVLTAMAMLLLAGAAFTWGFVVCRHQVFPFQFMQTAKGWLAPKPPEASRELVEARSTSGDLERLQALGYLDSAFDEEHEKRGVVLHDDTSAFPGLNLYCSRTENTGRLVDMNGRQVHSWSYPGPSWQHVELLPGGDLLVIVKNRALLRLDRDSRMLWSYRSMVHHDVWVDDPQILVLTRKAGIKPDIHPDREILEDFVVVLDGDGTELESISILEALMHSEFDFLLHAFEPDEFPSQGPPLDLLHTNHVEMFDGRLAHISPIYANGNLLLSCRNINTVLILDGITHEVAWLWGPSNLTFQHHSSLLENGHILIFDNGVEASRVIEVDPLTNTIVWRYREKDFFSLSRGSAQRLANGNTLITESDSGYVFEVTPEGRRVWMFANPDVSGNGERSAIWRMKRIKAESLGFEAIP